MSDVEEGKGGKSNKVFPLEPSHILADTGKKNSLSSLESVTVSDSKWSEYQEEEWKKRPCCKENKGFFASYICLYEFADRVDYRLMAVGLLCALLQAIIPPFVWLIMGDFVTHSINREEYRVGVLSSSENVSSAILDQQFAASATPAFLAMLVLSVTMFFAAFFQRLAWEISGIRQVFRIKTAYVRKLLHMDISWLESRQSGQVAAMLHENADSIYEAIADHLPMVVFIFTYLIVNIGLCLYTQWDVTLIMCTAIPLLILSRILFSKWFARTLNEENRLQAKTTNLVNETFSCIRTVIAFAAQKQTINKFEKISSDSNRLTEARLRHSTVYDSLTQILLTEMVFTVALCYGIWRVGDTTPGALCALAINMLYMCVTSISIGFHMNGASLAKTNAHQMGEIFRESPKIEKDRCYFLAPIIPPATKYRRQSMKFLGKGAIEFRDIHFTYPSRPDTEVLKGLSLSVEAGERVAIVGPSGSGKSTLTALLLRFYDPNSGSVTLDGDNLKNMCPDELRSQLALVSQEPVLFDGTISDNIRYGRLDATQQEINTAARKVGAWDFISKLPEGMQTRVGDRGLQLSGGQKQRVAIARAVLRRPAVLIFDEATSALDNIHEEEVTQAIDLASEGLTTITIAHRLSTVRSADRIIVLDNGKIVEEGAPEDLLEIEGGRFRKMYADQGLDKLPPQPPGALKIHSRSTPFLEEGEKAIEEFEKSAAQSSMKRGKSYSCSLYNNRDKLAKAGQGPEKSSDVALARNIHILVLRKKKEHHAGEHRTNFHDMDVDDRRYSNSSQYGESNWDAIKELIRGYRSGYSLLAAAIPVTVVRAFFYLLICFEVSSILEISIVPEHDRPQQILLVGAAYTALIIVKTIFEALGRLFIALYGHGFACYMRSEMFRQVLRHGCAYFDEERNSVGKLVYKITSDSATLNNLLEQKLDLLIPAVVCSIFSIIVALIINWKMALLCGFQFPVYFAIRIVQLREGSKRQRRMNEEENKAAALASNVLANMSTIKAYNLQEHFYGVFTDALKPLAKAMKRQSLISAFAFACQYSFTYILIAITLHFGKVMMLANEISVFDYMRVVLLTQFGANFFSQLIASVSDFSKARSAADSVMRVLKEDPGDTDNLSEEGLRPKIEGNISIDDIFLKYPSRPKIPILKGLSINIEAGEMVGVVGPSGAGKSSLFHILQRLYSNCQGEITIDGSPVSSINPTYLRRKIVAVGQEPTLFSFTIKENIAYGMLESEYTMEDIFRASKIAKIHDFIVSLPQGYETEVGEFGAQLSGGQKQRIAIARALVRRPPVLLCDEATAALDSFTERAVREAFLAQKEKSTLIKIAHRLSSIKTCNRIYVIVDGRVAEEGSHEFLMNRKGIYYDMVNTA